MTNRDITKLIQEALESPTNKEFARKYLTEQFNKQEIFRQSVPELVNELQRRGISWIPGTHLGKLIRSGCGSEVITAILEVISNISNSDTLLTLVECLEYYNQPYNATAIIELFYKNSDPKLRRSICRVLLTTKAQNIDEWARQIIFDPAYGKNHEDCRTELVFFSANLKKKEGLADLVMSVFSEMPLYVPYPLGKLAEERHLDFMRDRLAHVEDYPIAIQENLRDNLLNAISKAEKRLAREAVRREKLAQNEAEKQRLREDKQRLTEDRKQSKRGKL